MVELSFDSIVYLSKYSNINIQAEETSALPRNTAVTNFKLILKIMESIHLMT
jgi:hypothetical protein